MSRFWRCGEFDLSLDSPIVMGILNVTPDSFSDGGVHQALGAAVSAGLRLWGEGAAIVDVGGESTRPGAKQVSPADEIRRVLPVVERLVSMGQPVSIDTRHAEVAASCVSVGACIINDVSGFRDRAMVDVAAGCEAGVVVMHMLGEPGTMQRDPHYDDVVSEVRDYLLAQAGMLEKAGVERERIMLDPGIGFGKTLSHNLALLSGLTAFTETGYPVLVGASRKRFISEISGADDPGERLGGSVAAVLETVNRGAAVIRVHDVAATVQALAVAQAITGTEGFGGDRPRPRGVRR